MALASIRQTVALGRPWAQQGSYGMEPAALPGDTGIPMALIFDESRWSGSLRGR